MVRAKKIRDQKSKGFTLIEVLVVASIIGILAAIAIPSLAGSKRAAYEAACVKALRSITDAQEMYYRDNFAYTGDWAALDEYLPVAYSSWERKHFFIDNYSLEFETSYSNQRYTVFAWPRDTSLRLQTFAIMDDGIPLYDDFTPVN